MIYEYITDVPTRSGSVSLATVSRMEVNLNPKFIYLWYIQKFRNIFYITEKGYHMEQRRTTKLDMDAIFIFLPISCFGATFALNLAVLKVCFIDSLIHVNKKHCLQCGSSSEGIPSTLAQFLYREDYWNQDRNILYACTFTTTLCIDYNVETSFFSCKFEQ